MIRGLYIAEGAMITQQARMEILGHNLANQQTPGFKKDNGIQTSFGEWLLYARNTTGLPESPYPIGTMAHNVALSESYTSMRDGNLNNTGRSLDFAITGNGLFQVENEDGVLYTRNGHMFLNADGYLVDVEGRLILGENGPIQVIAPGREAFVDLERDIAVEPDGSILVLGEFVDRFDLVAFDPELNFTKVGDNYFEPFEAAVELDTVIVNRYLEGSNVDLAAEMVKMMEIRRNYEAAQKIMITYDGILNKAANELGSSG